jgi:Ankyrin repeat
MKYRNVHFVISALLVLPLMINGMKMTPPTLDLVVVPKEKKDLRDYKKQRSDNATGIDYKWLNDIRSQSFDETANFIPTTIPKNIERCEAYNLMERIVFKAIRNKEIGYRYVRILEQIRNHIDQQAYDKMLLYGQDIMHLAVNNNLYYMTAQLLQFNKKWVNSLDSNDRIPLHYAQSCSVAQLLLKAGSDVNTQDKEGYTPMHLLPSTCVGVVVGKAHMNVESSHEIFVPACGLLKMTPLYKAICDGDLKKVQKILSLCMYNQEEHKILYEIAKWKLNRTGEAVFSDIKKVLMDDSNTFSNL